ncbi:type 1 glutamine amidotransferase [[Clostridium] spiroforme]|nr:type 1 glutamine amidotransferase [Thomasclavelia spiroformis]
MKTLFLLTPLKTIDHPRGKQYYIYQYYIDMFKKLNAELICIAPSNVNNYEKLSEICDGLLLTGGLDIDASYFDEENLPVNQLELPEVDQMDIELIKLFHQQKKPIIGICRGHQLINIAFGGTLYQDIPAQYHTSIQHSQKINQQYCHSVSIMPNSSMAQFFPKQITVNSFHHQAIKKLAKGFQVMAYSEDGLIEAMENDRIMSVQWHPEKISDENQDKIVQLFKTLFQ